MSQKHFVPMAWVIRTLELYLTSSLIPDVHTENVLDNIFNCMLSFLSLQVLLNCLVKVHQESSGYLHDPIIQLNLGLLAIS